MNLQQKIAGFLQVSFLVWIFVVAFSASSASAQQPTGIVKFLINNQNGYFEIMVDDTLLIKRYKDTLTAGPHKAQIWSFGYDVKDVEFTIVPDTVTQVYVKLDRSDAYMAYAQSYHNYRMDFHKAVTLPVSLTLGMGVTAGIFMLKGYDIRRQINADIAEYSMIPDSYDIEVLKASVERNNQKYNNYRYGYYITGGLTLVGIAGSIYSSVKFKRTHDEPTYSKSSPFQSKSSFYVGPGGFQFIYRIG